MYWPLCRTEYCTRTSLMVGASDLPILGLSLTEQCREAEGLISELPSHQGLPTAPGSHPARPPILILDIPFVE